jgi:hypothetical protein
MWRNPGFLRRLPPPQAADLSGIVLWRASIAGQADQRPDFAGDLIASRRSSRPRAEFSGEKFFVGYNVAASLALSVLRFCRLRRSKDKLLWKSYKQRRGTRTRQQSCPIRFPAVKAKQ